MVSKNGRQKKELKKKPPKIVSGLKDKGGRQTNVVSKSGGFKKFGGLKK